MNMKSYVMLLIMMAVGLGACSGDGQKSGEPIHSVEVVLPEQAGGAGVRSFSGTVVAADEVGAGFKTMGHIARILVKEGDFVRKGQTIATLDATDIRLQVQNLQSQYDQTSREVARLKKLYEGRSLSGNDYDKATAGLEQLRLMLEQQKNTQRYTTLTAPVSGYVKEVQKKESEMAQEGEAVVTISGTGDMEIKTNLPAYIYNNRKRIEVLGCTSSQYPEVKASAKLKSITPIADGNQLYEARFTVKEGVFTAGENVEIEMSLSPLTSHPIPEQSSPTRSLSPLVAVPMKAVFKDGTKSYVWVVSADSTVTKREVCLDDMDDQGRAIIAGSLKGDEKVVKAGVDILQEGEKVRVITQPTESNVGGMM